MDTLLEIPHMSELDSVTASDLLTVPYRNSANPPCPYQQIHDEVLTMMPLSYWVRDLSFFSGNPALVRNKKKTQNISQPKVLFSRMSKQLYNVDCVTAEEKRRRRGEKLLKLPIYILQNTH